MLKRSLVIGYCICANCRYTDNKFNWHTYFQCPVCGCSRYTKPDLWGENDYESERKIDNYCDLLAATDDSR